MVGLLCRDDWSIGDQRKVDSRVGHQVGLEFSQVHIQYTIEIKRSGNGGHYLADDGSG